MIFLTWLSLASRIAPESGVNVGFSSEIRKEERREKSSYLSFTRLAATAGESVNTGAAVGSNATATVQTRLSANSYNTESGMLRLFVKSTFK